MPITVIGETLESGTGMMAVASPVAMKRPSAAAGTAEETVSLLMMLLVDIYVQLSDWLAGAGWGVGRRTDPERQGLTRQFFCSNQLSYPGDRLRESPRAGFEPAT